MWGGGVVLKDVRFGFLAQGGDGYGDGVGDGAEGLSGGGGGWRCPRTLSYSCGWRW